MKDKVIEFPKLAEERARKLRAEVERLSRLPPVEWMFYLPDVATKHAVDAGELKKMVEATIAATEKQRREDKAEHREVVRLDERARRETRRVDTEREKKEKEKRREREKELRAIAKLPRLAHAASLSKLAERLGEDVDALRTQLEFFVSAEDDGVIAEVEPWPEPVALAELLDEALAMISRYVVIHDESARIAIVLWVALAWVHEIAVHSPILEFTSADAGEGKSTLCGVLSHITPRGDVSTELTGPALYRFVDQVKPTLIIDDADRLLSRRPDLVHIVNAGWTRGVKIRRQVNGVTRWFDPFCPKIISGKDLYLPSATKTRCITVKLLPKLKSEEVVDFDYVDDENFVTLRRKFARFAADSAVALRDARPEIADLNNRAKMNWRLQVAIADLAGEKWPEAARVAASTIGRDREEPSEGKRLLAAVRLLFVRHGRWLLSNEIGGRLAELDDEWANFRGKSRAINKWEVAVLLKPYGIEPSVIHARGREVADRGYDGEKPPVAKAFRYYLPDLPGGRTHVSHESTKKSKSKPRRKSTTRKKK